jgi:hypothetical protein
MLVEIEVSMLSFGGGTISGLVPGDSVSSISSSIIEPAAEEDSGRSSIIMFPWPSSVLAVETVTIESRGKAPALLKLR